MDLNKR